MKRSMDSTDASKRVTLEVLAAGGNSVIAAAQNGRLFICGSKTSAARVCGAAVSNGIPNLVAAITLDKEVVVFACQHEGDAWTEVAKHLLPKRPTALSFSATGNDLVVADGFGDVFRLPSEGYLNLREGKHSDALLLGHFSTVTCLAISQRWIATADRDNKLRISKYPDCYIVQSFCLGHEEFITCVAFAGDSHLISGAGDGTIRLWDVRDGRLLKTLHMRDFLPAAEHNRKSDEQNDIVTSVHVSGDDASNAFFTLYGRPYIYLLSGLLSNGAKGVQVGPCFPTSSAVSGTAIDKSGRLLVSMYSEPGKIHVYSTDPESAEIFADSAMDVCEKTATVSSSWGSEDVEFVLKFDWLCRQRKREMVENWKGKKRKHIDI